MISLSKYLSKQFTVAGTSSKKILLFDVDDTLINTTARIGIAKDEQIIKWISNSEFNDYHLGRGESFDFREFNSKKILNKETFTKYWNTLKREYNKGTHIGIITARSIGNEIRKFFLRNGIDIKKELVFAVGDPKYPFQGTIQQKKAQTIELLSKLGYNTFVFFDDNEDNLKQAKQLEHKLNIKVNIVKVQKTYFPAI